MTGANTSAIRVVTIEDNPWFVAKDIGDALGYVFGGPKGSAKNFLTSLRSDEVMLLPKSKVDPIYVSFPNRGLNVISESGLYKLVMRSDKKEAREFQDWVTKTVLPAIRKDGGYIMGEEKVVTGEMSEDELQLSILY